MRGGGRRRRVIDGFELYDACDGRERGVSWDTAVVATHAMTMTMGEGGDGRGLGTTRARVRVRVRGRVVVVRESDDDDDHGDDDDVTARDASDGVIDEDVLSCSLVVGVESDDDDQKGCKESRGFFVNVSDGPYELGAPSERYRTMYAKRFTRAYDLACRLMRALNRNSRVRFDAIVREILTPGALTFDSMTQQRRSNGQVTLCETFTTYTEHDVHATAATLCDALCTRVPCSTFSRRRATFRAECLNARSSAKAHFNSFREAFEERVLGTFGTEDDDDDVNVDDVFHLAQNYSSALCIPHEFSLEDLQRAVISPHVTVRSWHVLTDVHYAFLAVINDLPPATKGAAFSDLRVHSWPEIARATIFQHTKARHTHDVSCAAYRACVSLDDGVEYFKLKGVERVALLRTLALISLERDVVRRNIAEKRRDGTDMCTIEHTTPNTHYNRLSNESCAEHPTLTAIRADLARMLWYTEFFQFESLRKQYSLLMRHLSAPVSRVPFDALRVAAWRVEVCIYNLKYIYARKFRRDDWRASLIASRTPAQLASCVALLRTHILSK